MTTPLTTSALAALLGMTRAGVADAADAGRLPCTRTPGGHRRFHPPELVAALQDQGASVPQKLAALAAGVCMARCCGQVCVLPAGHAGSHTPRSLLGAADEGPRERCQHLVAKGVACGREAGHDGAHWVALRGPRGPQEAA